MRTLWVRPAPASAGTVRRCLAFELHEAGFSADLSDDIVLITTELLNNAILHARPLPNGHIEVDWDLTPGQARVQVVDGGGVEEPHVTRARSDETTGRGLAIVGHIADAWGVDRSSECRSVWAVRRANGGPGLGNGNSA